MVNTIIGIDPGLKGSMAFLKTDGTLTVERLPILIEQRKTRAIRSIDTGSLIAILRSHTGSSITNTGSSISVSIPNTGSSVSISTPDAIAIVEDVFSMPRDSRRGAFTFGGVKTAITSSLRLCGIRTVFVSPSVWKGQMQLSADKKRSRALAEKVFPNFKFKSIDDCEAALLAVYLLLHRKDTLTETSVN